MNEKSTVKDVLILIGAGAFIAASLIMPGLPLAAKLFDSRFKKYNKRRLKHTLKRLYHSELISTKEINDEVILTLTKKGEQKVLKYKIDELKITEPKRWDKKWRLVIFDIPNSKKQAREVFRELLKRLGFVQLQKSVFLQPFPCEDEIEFLRLNFGISKFVQTLIISKLENEEFYKQKFNL